MKNLWSDAEAVKWSKNPLDLRVYTSRLLGQNSDLVLHGGGNTSVKITEKNPFGEKCDYLYVKGSGWDLKTIERKGFSPVDLNTLKKMAELTSLTDSNMVKYQRAAMSDPTAPNPSIEAIMHGILPFKYVDHTHADAVVTLTNNPRGREIINKVYGDRVYLVPYVMPGFILAKLIYRLLNSKDIHKVEGIILMNHGIFSFHDDAKTSYSNMIDLVTVAENYIANKSAGRLAKAPNELDLLTLTAIRKKVSSLRGSPVIVKQDSSPEATGFSRLKNVKTITGKGPLTPDHSIRTKRNPVVIDSNIEKSFNSFSTKYKKYFDSNKKKGHTCLDPAPRWGIWPGYGTLAFGGSLSEADIIQDISRHTIKCIQFGENIGGWQALSEKKIFEIEYWELEQAKLKKAGTPKGFTGKIALITGAASGIGRAAALKFHSEGCVVVGLDINEEIEKHFNKSALLGIQCDVTNSVDLKCAVDKTVEEFGGLDIIVCNAGIFSAGNNIDEMDAALWEQSLKLNLTASQKLMEYSIPYLKNGIDPSILIIASRNVMAPGPGAAAYSVAKAGLTQLGRIAALELAPFAIRVNTIHPDAVFDTGLWTKEVLIKSARRYNMSVNDYKKKNLLKTEITSEHVAELIYTVAGPAFTKTTGAQIPIDGGNDRVI